jgi:tetratricopeptide (TPR) repeat protein
MTSEMAAISPGGVTAIDKKLAELNPVMDQERLRWQKYYQTVETGTMDAAVEAASQAPAEIRDQLYQHLAQKAAAAGDFERAKQILKDHIANPSQRQQALSNLDQQAIQIEAAKGRIVEALRIVSNLRTPRERATVLSQIVNQIGSGQKRGTALELLEQARAMLGSATRVESQEQMTALLEIGRAFARYDSKRAFEIVEPMLDQFNEMSAAAMVLDGFGQQYYQDGELVMQNGNSVGNTATQLTTTLGILAVANFDRAKAAADRVERPEVRIGVYLAIAQQTISPTEKAMTARW